MGRTLLNAGIETLKTLSFASLAGIWQKATGEKPPVGTKKVTLLESVEEMFRERAKTEGEPEIVSTDCEVWLAEFDGVAKPKKAAKTALEPESQPEPEPAFATVTVEQAITALDALPTKRMAAVHEMVVGKPAKGLKKPQIFKAIAQALAKKADGRGSGATLPAEITIWMNAATDTTGKKSSAKKEPKERDARLPEAGSIISKVWRDRTLEVVVNKDDFTFEGKTFKSLSKIASELLGCPANGFLFFSLTDGAKAAAAKRDAKAAAKQAAAEANATPPALVTDVQEKPAKSKKPTKKTKPTKKAAKG